MKKITSAAAAVQASITQQNQIEEKPASAAKTKERTAARKKAEPEKKAGGRPKIYGEETTRVNFKVPATFLQDVKYLANVEGKSMTQLFLSVFEDAIKQHEKEIKALKKMRGEI